MSDSGESEPEPTRKRTDLLQKCRSLQLRQYQFFPGRQHIHVSVMGLTVGRKESLVVVLRKLCAQTICERRIEPANLDFDVVETCCGHVGEQPRQGLPLFRSVHNRHEYRDPNEHVRVQCQEMLRLHEEGTERRQRHPPREHLCPRGLTVK